MSVLTPEEERFLEELFRSEYKKMLSLAIRKLRNAQNAEDIVQDTFTVALLKIKELISNPNPKGWLYVVLKNKIMHEYRAKARFLVVWGKLEAAFSREQTWKNEKTSDIFEELPQTDYELLRLIYIDGYTNREVAELKGISYDACRKAVQRAKEKVRKIRK